MLDRAAYTCYKSLPQEVKDNYQLIKQQFLAYFAPTELPIDERYEQLIDVKLKKGENVQHHFDTIMKKTANWVPMPLNKALGYFKVRFVLTMQAHYTSHR